MKNIITGIVMGLIILNYGIVAYSADGELEKADNLLPYTFEDEDGDGFPEGYKGYNTTGKIFYDHEVYTGASGPSIRIDLKEEGDVYLDLDERLSLEQGKKYLFSVYVKVKDMRFAGKWWESGVKHAVTMYVYGLNDKQNWMAIAGNGSTDGCSRKLFLNA